MSGRVRLYGKHGAGEYGAVSREPVHRCGRCANPFTGGNPACPNNRPSQASDCPASSCDRDVHDDCWRGYERQESEYKYRHIE